MSWARGVSKGESGVSCERWGLSRARLGQRGRGACWGRVDWAEGRWIGGQDGSSLDGEAQPVRREGEALHWCGHEREKDEWGRGGGAGGVCPWHMGPVG